MERLNGDLAETARVAAVNFEPVPGDKEATFVKMKACIDEAAAQGCDLVILPEMALNGFEHCEACRAHATICDAHLAEGELAAGPFVQRLVDVVKGHDMYAVIGFCERDPVERKIYNAAAVIGPAGLMGTSRKMGNGHRAYMYSHGEELKIYQTRFGPMGVGICYDMWMNPELPRLLVHKGARLIAIPTATVSTTGAGELEKMAYVRARESMVFIAAANLVRSIPGQEPRGFSVIAGPRYPEMGTILARNDDPQSMVVADLDFNEYERYAQQVHPIRKRRRTSDLLISQYVAREYAALAEPAPQVQPAVAETA